MEEVKVLIKQSHFQQEVGKDIFSRTPECGNCGYKDILKGFLFKYDWESGTCQSIRCPKCESQLIYESKYMLNEAKQESSK